jgi:DNA-binding NtrC family response regulator
MPRAATLGTLTRLLDQSSRPIYVVDAELRIVYCNPALATWIDVDAARIMGRAVEYHSETRGNASVAQNAETPLAELCPPPRALSGEPCVGTNSCVARGGSLIHRSAQFVPLDDMSGQAETGIKSRRRNAGTVLVLLGARDLTPVELSSTFAGDPTEDELHRTIRQFRRAQSAAYAVESLLGESAAMRKIRAQVAAAASSGANCLIVGPRGSGRGHVARAIHYQGSFDVAIRLIPFDCALAGDDSLRQALMGVANQRDDIRGRPTLLLENIECLPSAHQTQLLSAIRQNMISARIVATAGSRHISDSIAGNQGEPTMLEPALADAISTITVRIPPLVERLEDLPVLTQYFLESCNRGSDQQIGSVRREALDLLALYRWPGELGELRTVISAAHRACRSHEIGPSDLPTIIHHAAHAAARSPRRTERIVLDELLVAIEKEAIVRALSQAGGNKTEAAELLGMTRPRLYRRLVQLGLVAEPVFNELESPEFIEQDPKQDAS